jgi:hypothetical protein
MPLKERTMAKRKYGTELPATLARSPDKAQRTFAKTLNSAEQSYGSGEQARRTAFASLKHSFEKRGDHWEAKDRPGPSDPQAAKSGRAARAGAAKTFGGVDAIGQSQRALYERARELGVRGRSSMRKDELAQAIAKKQK